MTHPRKLILIGLILVIAGIVGLLWRNKAPEIACDVSLSKTNLEESLALGTQFILANQKPEGNFEYEYDWLAQTYNPDDNGVRQAGALWGLALIYEYTLDPKLIEPLERSFTYFENHSKVRADGARYILYPTETSNGLGTVALVALAHIEYLNAHESELSATELTRHKNLLDGYLRFVSTAVNKDKLFAGSYDENGVSGGRPSSYSDGEALLALAKAARYRGYDWQDQVKTLADAGYKINVQEALAEDPDSDITKGYYQWSTMAYRELFESGWDDTKKYGDYAIELANWMLDTHKVLDRTRNTGYAFEGLISAKAIATAQGDSRHAHKFACTSAQGLTKLSSWQVGSSQANKFITNNPTNDVRALGGIQNGSNEAPLRIDVTQHQMHAVILALEELL